MRIKRRETRKIDNKDYKMFQLKVTKEQKELIERIAKKIFKSTSFYLHFCEFINLQF